MLFELSPVDERNPKRKTLNRKRNMNNLLVINKYAKERNDIAWNREVAVIQELILKHNKSSSLGSLVLEIHINEDINKNTAVEEVIQGDFVK